MTDYAKADIFTDVGITENPYPYFEYLRAQGPVTTGPTHDVVHVTGYDEGVAIFRDDEGFSAINCTAGPFLPLAWDPARPVDELLAQCRKDFPFADTIINQDLPHHNRSKAVLNGIITPARLKENEAFMGELCDRIIDEFIAGGRYEVVSQYGQPFAQLVIADLLGVPAEDHARFRTMIGKADQMPGTLGGKFDFSNNPLMQIGMTFYGYIVDRRANPTGDVLTRLALQTLEDGTLPDPVEVVAVATFLFGAGQDTTVQLFCGMMRYLAENPGLEDRLRADRGNIPDFIDEVLRLQGTTKSTFRYAKKDVEVAGRTIPAGSHVMLHYSGMNRDPRRFADPERFDIDRDNGRTHVAFGRGIHACAGAPLARAEARVTLNRMLDRMKNFRFDEDRHGPAGARRFDYLQNYSLRGVNEMHVLFDRID